MKPIRFTKHSYSVSLMCYELVIFNFLWIHWHIGGTQAEIYTNNSDVNPYYPIKPRFRLRGMAIGNKDIHLPFIKEYSV